MSEGPSLPPQPPPAPISIRLPSAKRARPSSTATGIDQGVGDDSPRGDDQRLSLPILCLTRSWEAAAVRARSHPHEAGWGCTSQARTPVDLTTPPPPAHTPSPVYTGARGNSAINTVGAAVLSSTPLALACRYSAPLNAIRAICLACPAMNRRSIPSRGTPLHEAVHGGSWDREGPGGGDFGQVVRTLLEADEALDAGDDARSGGSNLQGSAGSSSTRAALTQDVDGNVPLHLLVRRCFSSPDAVLSLAKKIRHNQASEGKEGNGESVCDATFANASTANGQSEADDNGGILSVMSLLIKSAPKAVGVPDRREFEETPLVAALKANLYAAGFNPAENGGEDDEDGAVDYDSDGDVSGIPESALSPPRSSEAGTSEELQPAAEAEAIARARRRRRQSRLESYETTLEGTIHSVVLLMLRHCPEAATHVAISGYGNTALHSAVFHGRCSDTVQLLLRAASEAWDQRTETQDKSEILPPVPAALRTNTLGETALHFAAMRGEGARTVELIANAAPGAVLRREGTTDLTPIHWLWVRFVDRTLGRLGRLGFGWYDIPDWEDNASAEKRDVATKNFARTTSSVALGGSIVDGFQRDSQVCVRDLVEHDSDTLSDVEARQSITSSRLEDTFDGVYFARTRRVDPPVDFIRMRHVPVDFLSAEGRIGRRAGGTLRKLSRSHSQNVGKAGSGSSGSGNSRPAMDEATAAATRGCPYASDVSSPYNSSIRIATDIIEEQATSLFWTKVVSLLRCAFSEHLITDSDSLVCHSTVKDGSNSDEAAKDCFLLVHAAASTPGTPPSIARLASSLHPEQLSMQDARGRLPLHHAAMRKWHPREIAGPPGGRAQNQSPPPFAGPTNQGPSYRIILANPKLRLIHSESLRVFKHVLSVSAPESASIRDLANRIPLHYAIETAVRVMQVTAATHSTMNASPRGEENSKEHMKTVTEFLDTLIQFYPESLEKMDGVTGLLPFMMPAAIAARMNSDLNSSKVGVHQIRANESASHICNLTYHLLRQNPSLVGSGLYE